MLRITFTVFVLLLAAFLGVNAGADPGIVLPLSGELLFLVGCTFFFLRLEKDQRSRSWLFRLVLAAVGIRFVLLLIIHFGLSPYTFAPDALLYEYYGEALRDFWLGLGPKPGRVFDSWEVGYFFINGAFYYLFQDSPIGPVVLNLIASVWTCILTFFLGRALFGESVGKTAAVLTALFPSLVLWSVLNIRDAISTFLVTSIVLIGVRALRRFGIAELVGSAVGLLLLSWLRDYMAVLVFAGLVLGLIAAARPDRIGGTLVSGVIIVAVLIFGAQSLGLLQAAPVESPLAALETVRHELARGAGSAYGADLDTSSLRGLLVALPIGLAYFLFAPFPWAINSPLQLGTLPEVLLWYLLIPFTLVGLQAALRSKWRASLVPIGVLLVVVFTYALVEGNVGTAYRHRAQIMPLFFLYSAAGIERLRARRAAYLADREEKRKRVSPAWSRPGSGTRSVSDA